MLWKVKEAVSEVDMSVLKFKINEASKQKKQEEINQRVQDAVNQRGIIGRMLG